MNQTLKASFYVILYIVLFALLQALCAACLVPFHLENATMLILASAISSILTLVLFILTRWTDMGLRYILTCPIAVLLWVCLLSIALVLPMQYLEELIPIALPERLADTFKEIINHNWGYIVIGILAPVTEEVVFRGAILRKLLSINCHTWIAIAISAVLFGAVHGNLAQFVHAFIMGILLGWLYTRTRSILPCLLVHWVNNTVAFILIRAFPEHADDNLITLFGNNIPLLTVSLLLSIAVAVVALWRIILHK